MKLTKSIFVLCLVLSTGLIAVSFGLDRSWPGVLLAAGIALLWAIGFLWRQSRLVSFAFFGLTALTAVGVIQLGNPFTMLVGAIASLAAWDLSRLIDRMRVVQFDANIALIEKSHLKKLALVSSFGLIISGLGVQIRLGLSLGIILLFGLILAISISLAYRRMQTQEPTREKA
jgi:hypothetical protein